MEKKLFFILISFSIQFVAHVSTQDGVEHWQEWKPEGIETVYFCAVLTYSLQLTLQTLLVFLSWHSQQCFLIFPRLAFYHQMLTPNFQKQTPCKMDFTKLIICQLSFFNNTKHFLPSHFTESIHHSHLHFWLTFPALAAHHILSCSWRAFAVLREWTFCSNRSYSFVTVCFRNLAPIWQINYKVPHQFQQSTSDLHLCS